MRRALIILAAGALLAGCAAAGPASSCCRETGSDRWTIHYKPHPSGSKENTLLLDRATGRTWFFDISQTHWWEIPRNNLD